MRSAQSSSEELALVSQLTIKNVAQVAAEIAAALSKSDRVELSLPEGSDVDVSFLQLLVSAQKSAEASGKAVRLAHPPAGAFRDALVRSGLFETELSNLWKDQEVVS